MAEVPNESGAFGTSVYVRVGNDPDQNEAGFTCCAYRSPWVTIDAMIATDRKGFHALAR